MSFYGAGVEYGMHILLVLAGASHDARPSARDLADFQGLPIAYMRKIMGKLERAGLVEGTEGIDGGWRLAVPPEKITTLAVAEAVEGRRALFECREIRANCILFDGRPPRHATSGICSIHAVMIEAESRMRAALVGRTLADIKNNVAKIVPRSAGKAAHDWFNERVAARRGQRRPMR